MSHQTTDFAFAEQSGRYVVTPPSRHDLAPELKAGIHDRAVEAYKEGLPESANPFSHGCPAFLQWEHSYSEFKECCDAQAADCQD